MLRAAVVPIVLIELFVHALNASGDCSRLVAIGALFLLAADLASLARGATQHTLVMVASLLLGIVAIEGVAMARAPRVEFLHPPGFWSTRPDLGWGPAAPGRYPVEERVNGKTIYKVTYTIDQDLLRATASTANAPLVAFFGDSFTYGEGVEDADTLPQSFADLAPGMQVANLAFSGYSPAQVLRELQLGLFDKRLVGARAFVMLTGPWHAERTACKVDFSIIAPRFEDVDGKPEYKGPCFSGFAKRVQEFYKGLAAYNWLLAPLLQRPTKHDIETYLEIVGEVARVARERHGVPLVVLYVPPADRYLDGTNFTDRSILERLRADGIHVIDASLKAAPGEVLAIPGDGHPNGTANRLRAKQLVDDLKTKLPDVLAAPKPSDLQSSAKTSL